MSEQANQTITALRTGRSELATFVGSLSSDDLTQPSGAAEWNETALHRLETLDPDTKDELRVDMEVMQVCHER